MDLTAFKLGIIKFFLELLGAGDALVAEKDKMIAEKDATIASLMTTVDALRVENTELRTSLEADESADTAALMAAFDEIKATFTPAPAPNPTPISDLMVEAVQTTELVETPSAIEDVPQVGEPVPTPEAVTEVAAASVVDAIIENTSEPIEE